MSIKLLHNSKIDLIRWDDVIHNSSNSRIYAESWYLDIIQPDWCGIIYGEYDYVMPVVEGKKWGVSYVYQPVYAQQHGIFPTATPKITFDIIEFLQKKYPYINLSLNALNVNVSQKITVTERHNYVLSLQPSHDTIKKGYNAHAKRYVKKAYKDCQVSNHVNVSEYIRLKKAHSHKGFQKKFLGKLQLIMLKAINQNRGVLYGAYSARNELIASAFFLVERNRITYLNSVSTDEGKSSRAMYAIIDHFMQEYAGSGFLLDFEGSNIEGIARFFSGFGAKPEIYQQLHYNRLPWYLKLIKK